MSFWDGLFPRSRLVSGMVFQEFGSEFRLTQGLLASDLGVWFFIWFSAVLLRFSFFLGRVLVCFSLGSIIFGNPIEMLTLNLKVVS